MVGVSLDRAAKLTQCTALDRVACIVPASAARDPRQFDAWISSYVLFGDAYTHARGHAYGACETNVYRVSLPGAPLPPQYMPLLQFYVYPGSMSTSVQFYVAHTRTHAHTHAHTYSGDRL